jgi:UDP-N-acetylmuramyl pentapeptide phosphotransferase/UDP-N-acetylglucosamine-1-phosphate transferase
VMLSALAITRMMNSHLDLLVKGLAFIVVGIGFLAFNIHLSRTKRLQLTPSDP